MYKKFHIGIALIMFVSGFLFAQSQTPWWYTLEEGKRLYSGGAYGNALIAFEDARRERISRFTRMEQDLITVMSMPEVRRFGDSLEFIERYIAAHNETAAAAALAELYYRLPKDSLNGSANRALEELNRLKNYPEAEFWLGETYLAEGEPGLALRQYERAWQNRALLEIPGFDAEILYRITDILRMRREYQEMEKWANEIIEGTTPDGLPRDRLWAENRIRAAMARILENEGINRFLTMYRHNNAVTGKAHRFLGFFCYSSNRYSLAAEHLMFAFLIQNTVIIEEAQRRQYDFTFTTLNDLMAFARSRPELLAYLEETEYYRTAYYLASSLYAAGKTRPSRELWAFLAGSSGENSAGNAGEWGTRARRSPDPVVERTILTP